MLQLIDKTHTDMTFTTDTQLIPTSQLMMDTTKEDHTKDKESTRSNNHLMDTTEAQKTLMEVKEDFPITFKLIVSTMELKEDIPIMSNPSPSTDRELFKTEDLLTTNGDIESL